MTNLTLVAIAPNMRSRLLTDDLSDKKFLNECNITVPWVIEFTTKVSKGKVRDLVRFQNYEHLINQKNG